MQEVLKIHNYLTNEECDELLSFFFDDSMPYEQVKSEGDMAWKDRVKRPLAWPEKSFHTLTRKRISTAQAHFGVKFHPMPFNQVLNVWREGMEMHPHGDHAHGRYPERDYASLIYLNDDYDGGELYIPSLDIEVKPEKGMLLTFAGGTLMHGVKKVTRGTRYTNSCWLKLANA